MSSWTNTNNSKKVLRASAVTFSPSTFSFTDDEDSKSTMDVAESPLHGAVAAPASASCNGIDENSSHKNFGIYCDVDENDKMMEDIESEMHKADVDNLGIAMADGTLISSRSLPSTASLSSLELPSHMVGHAAEFWFPEYRDCTCCNGYKFGCKNCEGGCCWCAVTAVVVPANEDVSPMREDPVLPSTQNNNSDDQPAASLSSSSTAVGNEIAIGKQQQQYQQETPKQPSGPSPPCQSFQSSRGC